MHQTLVITPLEVELSLDVEGVSVEWAGSEEFPSGAEAEGCCGCCESGTASSTTVCASSVRASAEDAVADEVPANGSPEK